MDCTAAETRLSSTNSTKAIAAYERHSGRFPSRKPRASVNATNFCIECYSNTTGGGASGIPDIPRHPPRAAPIGSEDEGDTSINCQRRRRKERPTRQDAASTNGGERNGQRGKMLRLPTAAKGTANAARCCVYERRRKERPTRQDAASTNGGIAVCTPPATSLAVCRRRRRLPLLATGGSPSHARGV